MSTQLDRIERMLTALCDHLGVTAVKPPRAQMAADSAGAEAGRRYTGVVSRFEHGWGFIECESLGRQFFVYHRDVEGTGVRSLEVGAEVSFEVGPGKDGRPKAVRVRRQSADVAVPEPSKAAASPAAQVEPEAAPEPVQPQLAEVNGLPDDEIEDDMPQPESSAGDLLRSTARKAVAKRPPVKRTGQAPAARRRRSPTASSLR